MESRESGQVAHQHVPHRLRRGIDRIAFSLFGTIDGLHWDEVLSLDRLSLPPSKRVPISLFQGIRGYARYRVEFNDETVRQEVLRINVVAFGLWETDGPACPAVNEFPATFNQNISPGACPCGYVGYAYRRCVDGDWAPSCWTAASR